MFDNEVTWMFIAIAVVLCMVVHGVSCEKTAEVEAEAKVSIEAIKAGLVQSPEGFWVKPE